MRNTLKSLTSLWSLKFDDFAKVSLVDLIQSHYTGLDPRVGPESVCRPCNNWWRCIVLPPPPPSHPLTRVWIPRDRGTPVKMRTHNDVLRSLLIRTVRAPKLNLSINQKTDINIGSALAGKYWLYLSYYDLFLASPFSDISFLSEVMLPISHSKKKIIIWAAQGLRAFFE